MPDIYHCRIIEKEKLSDSLFEYRVASKNLAEEARPGQFLHIRCGGERILRRPIAVADVQDSEIVFVIEVKGEGTLWLSNRLRGDSLDILGPLGNGYSLTDGDVIVVGGSVGVPPLFYAAKSVSGGVTAVLGFRDKFKMMYLDEFESVCDKVYVTTDDGGYGIHGTVELPLELLLREGNWRSVLTCGNHAMMSAVARLCKKYDVPCQASLEERMACGVGACLVCACRTRSGGIESMKRVCADGPVFDANEVIW